MKAILPTHHHNLRNAKFLVFFLFVSLYNIIAYNIFKQMDHTINMAKLNFIIMVSSPRSNNVVLLKRYSTGSDTTDWI